LKFSCGFVLFSFIADVNVALLHGQFQSPRILCSCRPLLPLKLTSRTVHLLHGFTARLKRRWKF